MTVDGEKATARLAGERGCAPGEASGKRSDMAFDWFAFAGFCAFAAVSQLYGDYALMASAAVFNGALYCAAAHAATLAAFAFAGFRTSWKLPRALPVVAGAVACACAFVGFSAYDLAVCAVCSALQGAALATLSVAWGCYLGRDAADVSCLQVVLGLFVGSAVCFLVFVVDTPVVGQLAFAVLSLAAGGLWAFPRAADSLADGRRGVGGALPGFSVPASALVALGLCCVLSAFFSGVTLNPFAVQSKSVAAWMHLAVTVSFALMTAWCLALRSVRLQPFVLAGLVLLLAGLFMMSTGVTGSVIASIGLILATRSLFWGLGWVTVVALARVRPKRAMGVAAAGMLVAGGALGRGAGILMGGVESVSFTGLTVFGVVCIVLLALGYALMSASSLARLPVEVGFALSGGPDSPAGAGGGLPVEGPAPETAAADAGGAEGTEGAHPGRAAEEAIDGMGLTGKERDIARLILLNRTYADIAAEVGISERTVKFHAKNIYMKAGVGSKRQFLQEVAPPGPDGTDEK